MSLWKLHHKDGGLYLQEQPSMSEPTKNQFCDGIDFLYNYDRIAHIKARKLYDKHLKSLRLLPLSGEPGDRTEFVEGVDFYIAKAKQLPDTYIAVLLPEAKATEEEKWIEEFKAMVAADCKRMTIENCGKWSEFWLYLDKEFEEGKIDFHLRINADRTFYIHPQGKDGVTFDGDIN